MAYVTGLTRGRREWTPKFVKQIDSERCIGCGRCHKVCDYDVLVADQRGDEDESAKLFMKVGNPDNCIGCGACGRTCAKKAFSFEPMLAA